MKIKEQLANTLNDLNIFCWAGLVMWFQGYIKFKDIKTKYPVNDCKNEKICYCGKFKNGKM